MSTPTIHAQAPSAPADSSYMSRRLLRSLRRRVGDDQRGIGVIEVLASALILAVVAVGLLTGFDTASNASGNNKARAVAASIAQDDMERMRGLEVRTLIQRGPETRTVQAGAVEYSVKSTAEPVSDAATSGCTAGSTGVDYLRLKSEVTWKNMRIPTVVSDSIMAPRVGTYGAGEGGLSVRIVDRDGLARPGIAVSLAGSTTYNDTTDTDGCAFFSYVPTGDYNVRFSAAGMVTPAGVQAVDEPVSVPVGAVGNKVIQYDVAASLTVNFVSKRDGVDRADVGTDITVAHPNVPAPGALFFSTGGTWASGISTGASLFPFTSAYTIFSGGCQGANPSKFGAPPTTQAFNRGSTNALNIYEPPIDIVVKQQTSKTSTLPLAGAVVRFYGVTCPGVWTAPDATDATGRLARQGMPYGDYEVCVQGKDLNDKWRFMDVPVVVKNKSAAGIVTNVTMIMYSATGQAQLGTCSES